MVPMTNAPDKAFKYVPGMRPSTERICAVPQNPRVRLVSPLIDAYYWVRTHPEIS